MNVTAVCPFEQVANARDRLVNMMPDKRQIAFPEVVHVSTCKCAADARRRFICPVATRPGYAAAEFHRPHQLWFPCGHGIRHLAVTYRDARNTPDPTLPSLDRHPVSQSQWPGW